MKPFVPKTKSYYAVMCIGLDPDGCTGAYIAVIDGYNKKDAMKALQKEVEPHGVTILKITRCVSFAEREGATWLAKKWDAISDEILINGALQCRSVRQSINIVRIAGGNWSGE